MKKVIAIIMIVFVISAGTVIAFNSNEISATIENFVLKVNGNEVKLENPIVTINDRSYLPVRELSEILGFEVAWDEKTQTISVDNKTEENDNLYLFYNNGKYGYMDKDGNVMISAKYDYAYQFSEGVAVVGINNPTYTGSSAESQYLYGCIDKSGNEIVPCENDSISDFSEGYAIVRKEHDGESYFINKAGKMQFGRTFFDCGYFQNGYAAVKLKGAPYPLPPKYEVEWGFVDINGNIYDNMGWTSEVEFEHGYAVVEKNEKYGMLDTNFNLILPYKYDDIRVLSDDRIAIKEEKKYTLRDVFGNKISDEEFGYIGGFGYDSGFSDNGYIVVRKNGLKGYIDKQGNTVIPFQFYDADKFECGYASVKKEVSPGKYLAGIIDEQGNYVIEIETDDEYFSLEICDGPLFAVAKEYWDKETGKPPYTEYYYLDVDGNRIDPVL